MDEWDREMQAMLPEDDDAGVSAEEECATYLAEARNKIKCNHLPGGGSTPVDSLASLEWPAIS
jgi:hypothetical protein